MAGFTYIILLLSLYTTFAKDCIINRVPEQMAFEKQLRKDLKCGYHVFDPPFGNNTTSEINVRFVMKRFSFNSDEEIFSMQSWMFISWIDERLKWDPDKYYGTTETELTSMSLWTPGFRLFNSADSNDFDRYYYVWCRVRNTGLVSCVPKITHEALCSVKLTNWPYDQQECKLEFGPWSSKWSKFSMNFTSRAITMLGAEYGAEWFISDYRQEANFSSEKQLTMYFTLEREATGLAAIVVYPAIILTALSITCLFLDVRQNVRLAMISFSLFGHYYFLRELMDNLPKHSLDSPNLLFYYRGSLILTMFIALFTFLLDAICKVKVTPQNYFLTINDSVYESFGKYFIVPQWNLDDDTIKNKQFSEDWTKFANIINSAFNVIIILTYVILYCVLMPKPIPINY
nr:neuronal acetylcholine receptor subunit beta-2 [Helicoverpa armigera]